MKKLLFILIASVISFSAMAQLNVQSSSGKEDIIAKNQYATVQLTANGYVVSVNDWIGDSNARLDLFLGKTKESAAMTLNDILKWHAGAKNKDNIIVLDKLTEKELTLYRYNGLTIVLSEGNSEFIRKSINAKFNTGLLGAPNKKTHSNTPIGGQLTVKVLEKAYEELK